MKQRLRIFIHDANVFLSRPLVIVAILIVLFSYFAYGNVKFERENQQIIKNTNQAVDNGNAILKAQAQQLQDIKSENEQLKRYVSCLLAIHGQGNLVDNNVQAQCEKMSQAVTFPDVTKQPSTPVPAANTSQTSSGSSQAATSQNENQNSNQNQAPAKILGVPVCVPLTHVCVTR